MDLRCNLCAASGLVEDERARRRHRRYMVFNTRLSIMQDIWNALHLTCDQLAGQRTLPVAIGLCCHLALSKSSAH